MGSRGWRTGAVGSVTSGMRIDGYALAAATRNSPRQVRVASEDAARQRRRDALDRVMCERMERDGSQQYERSGTGMTRSKASALSR